MQRKLIIKKEQKEKEIELKKKIEEEKQRQLQMQQRQMQQRKTQQYKDDNTTISDNNSIDEEESNNTDPKSTTNTNIPEVSDKNLLIKFNNEQSAKKEKELEDKAAEEETIRYNKIRGQLNKDTEALKDTHINSNGLYDNQKDKDKKSVAEWEIQRKKENERLEKDRAEFKNGFDANSSYQSYDSAFELLK